MPSKEKKLFQNIDITQLSQVLNAKVGYERNNKPRLLYITESSEENSGVVGHISFNSKVRNPADFSVREATFLRKYGKAKNGTFQNQDFILTNGFTIFEDETVYILLDETENRYDDVPRNTWITLSKQGIGVHAVATVEELPSCLQEAK